MGLLDKMAKVGSKVLKDVTSDESKEKAKELFGAAKEFISDTAEKVTSEESKEKAKEFFENAKDKISEAATSIQNYVDDALKEDEPQKTEAVEESDGCTDVSQDQDCRSKILEVLSKEFSSYAVKENVSPATMGGQGRFMNYSIVVSVEDTPKLFIMLIGKTTCAHREYRWSKEFAASKGVEMINFIEHYPNEISYITNRLHKYL